MSKKNAIEVAPRMDYISVKEAAKNWGLTARMINYYCANGRIHGVQMIVKVWLIPKDAVRPEDRRKSNGRRPTAKDKERDS